MKLPIVAVLVLVVVLTTDGTEAGWVNKLLKKVENTVKKTIKNEPVKQVTVLVKKFAPSLLPRVLGKRSVDLPFFGTISDKRAQDMIGALDLVCLGFANAKNKDGLTANVVQSAFGASDGNQDKKLTGEEVDLFGNTLDAVRHCLELMRNKRK